MLGRFPKTAKVALFTALFGIATPMAVKASPCTDSVIADCGAAMADANWIQRIALGDLCAGLLAGCVISRT
ncbi:MAG: hypothetical protein ACR2NS_04905 [Gemmatimonadaceae bacterium]